MRACRFGATGQKIIERIASSVDRWQRLRRNPRQRLKLDDQASDLRWLDVLCQFRASTDRVQFVQLIGAGGRRERAALDPCAHHGSGQSVWIDERAQQ